MESKQEGNRWWREMTFLKILLKFLAGSIDLNLSLRSGWCWAFSSSPVLNCFMKSWALLLVDFPISEIRSTSGAKSGPLDLM